MTMTEYERRCVDDAIWQLREGYAVGALAILRALCTDSPKPTVPAMTPYERGS